MSPRNAKRASRTHHIGLIADTHGLLRPEAITALQGVDHIVHAGDIGDPEIISQLQAISPVTAVRGNNDTDAWAQTLPLRATVQFLAYKLHVVHELADLELDPATAGIDVVVTGHSHKPLVTRRDHVLFVNPGSAGPRRFNLPVSVSTLTIGDNGIDAAIHELPVARATTRRARR